MFSTYITSHGSAMTPFKNPLIYPFSKSPDNDHPWRIQYSATSMINSPSRLCCGCRPRQRHQETREPENAPHPSRQDELHHRTGRIRNPPVRSCCNRNRGLCLFHGPTPSKEIRQMTTTTRLIDQAKQKLGITSDYALAKAWKVTPQRVGHWRQGVHGLSDDKACEICELIGADPGPILLELQA